MSKQFVCGAAAVPISPLTEHLEGRLYLGGYDGYLGRPGRAVNDDLYARALILDQEQATVVLVALDLVGISNAHIVRIRRDASRHLRIPEDRVLVACTHTHASPDLQGLWGGVSPQYAAHVCRQAVQAVINAAANSRRCDLRAATTRLAGRTVNRRGWLETDDALTVLQAVDTDRRPMATVVNFAAHPTVLPRDNLLISRDFPGALVDHLERLLGGVAIFVNADQGDVTPNVAGDFTRMRAYGQALAEEAAVSIETAATLEPPLAAATQAMQVPLANAGLHMPPAFLLRAFLLAVRALGAIGTFRRLADRYPQRPRAFVFAALGLMAEHPVVVRERRLHLNTRASRIRIGDSFDLLAVPGEVLTRLGTALRARLEALATMFLGLTNDSLGYFVPEDEWMTNRNGNYEESVSLGPQAAPSLQAAAEALLARRLAE